MNLHEAYGDRYRKGWDESRTGLERDPQLMILVGRRGHVYVDGDDLCASIDSVIVGRRVSKLSGVEVLNEGTDGWNVRFEPKLLPKIANACGLYRRRRFSEAYRAKLTARLAKMRENRQK